MKRLESEANYSPPSSAEVKCGGSIVDPPIRDFDFHREDFFLRYVYLQL